MSKKSKKAARNKRLLAKRAKKAAQKARYQKFAEMGKNTKSKRFRAKGKKTARKKDHPNGPCGNVGCIKCFGINFKPFLEKGKPKGMPQWMYIRWKKIGPLYTRFERLQSQR